MKKINNKGFTLVELIATIVILSIIMGIGTYSITKIIKDSKEKDYELLIKEIVDATEIYYQECRFSRNDKITCPGLDGDGYYSFLDKDNNNMKNDDEKTLTLGTLVDYGYLKGNGTVKVDDNEKFVVVNPKTNENISICAIKYRYNTNTKKIEIYKADSNGDCPSSY